MIRLLAWSVAATVAQVAALLGVVHTLLRYAMLARGLPAWRLGDTLLTSPLLWLGATLAAAALTRVVVVTALRAGRAGTDGGLALAVGVAVAGAAMMWFGLRAVGKLY